MVKTMSYNPENPDHEVKLYKND